MGGVLANKGLVSLSGWHWVLLDERAGYCPETWAKSGVSFGIVQGAWAPGDLGRAGWK